jgi:chromosome segregation ATPase
LNWSRTVRSLPSIGLRIRSDVIDVIRRIHLCPFQQHADREFTFGPHVNTLVGSTAAGKSTVIRALLSVLMNRTKPSHTPWGATSTKVVLEVGDHTIERSRTPSSNTYLLDGEELKAFGVAVPPTVDAITRVRDVNVQWQFDPIFWFSETSPAVTAKINEIFDLSAIDTVVKSLSTELRQEKAKLAVCEERVVSAETSVNSTQWAVQAQEEVRAIRAAEDAVVHTTACVRYLMAKTTALREVIEQRVQSKRLLRDSEAVLEASAVVEWCEQRCGGLRKTIADLQNTASSRKTVPPQKRVDAVVAAWEAVESRQRRVASLREAVAVLRESRKPLPTKAADRIIAASESVVIRELRVRELRQFVHNLQQTAAIADLEASAPAVCPTCGQVVA